MTQEDSTFGNLDQFLTNLTFSPIEIIEGKDYLCLVISGDLHGAVGQIDESILGRLEKAAQQTVAFSFSGLEKVDEGTLAKDGEGLAKVLATIASKKKRIALVKCPGSLRKLIEKSSKITADYVDNLHSLQRKSESNPIGYLNEIETVIESTIVVFQKQFGIDVRPNSSIRAKFCGSGLSIQAQVIGTIDIAATQLVGQLIVTMPNSTVSKLCEFTLGTPLSPEDPDFFQIVGEVCNLILGYTKDKLNKEGCGIMQSLPKCFGSGNGKTEVTSVYVNRNCWLTEFETEMGAFNVYVSLDKAPK